MGADPTFNLAQVTKEADKALEQAKALQARQAEGQKKLNAIEKGITKLEGSLLSGNDKAKTTRRKTEIDDLQKIQKKDREKRKDKKRREEIKKTFAKRKQKTGAGGRNIGGR